MPEVGIHREGHGNAVPFVVGRTRGVTIGHVWKIVPDHFLVVLEATASQDNSPSSLKEIGLSILLGPHAQDFPCRAVLDQFPAR